MKGEILKGHLDLLILSVLRAGAAHGYSILSQLRERSGGAFDLPEGTIYPALHRLEVAGLLKSRWSLVQKRRRRIYELTGKGTTEHAARQEEWMKFSDAVGSVLRKKS